MGCQRLHKSRQRRPARISLGPFLLTGLRCRLELSQEFSKASPLPVQFSLADDPGWITDCDRVAGDISCNHGTGADEGVFPDCYSRIYRASRSYGCEPFDPCLEQGPVTMRPRILVVGEGDIGPDENAVLDRHSGRDENKRSDLTIIPYSDAFFDVNVSVYFRVLANRAAVKVYLVVDSGVFPDPRFLDNGIFRAAPHFAGISSAVGIRICIVRS